MHNNANILSVAELYILTHLKLKNCYMFKKVHGRYLYIPITLHVKKENGNVHKTVGRVEGGGRCGNVM